MISVEKALKSGTDSLMDVESLQSWVAYLESLLEMEHCTDLLSCVCQKCRRSIYHLQKLLTEFTTLKEGLKTKINVKIGHSQGPIRSRSPSLVSTGISPVAKKRCNPQALPPTARKELFPMQAISTHILQPIQLSTSQQSTVPPAYNPLPIISSEPLVFESSISESDIHSQHQALPSLFPLQAQLPSHPNSQSTSQCQHLPAETAAACKDVTVKVYEGFCTL